MLGAIFELTLMIILFSSCAIGLIAFGYASHYAKKNGAYIKELFSSLSCSNDPEVTALLWWSLDDLYSRVMFMNSVSALIDRKHLKEEVREKFPSKIITDVKKMYRVIGTTSIIFFPLVIILYFLGKYGAFGFYF